MWQDKTFFGSVNDVQDGVEQEPWVIARFDESDGKTLALKERLSNGEWDQHDYLPEEKAKAEAALAAIIERHGGSPGLKESTPKILAPVFDAFFGA